ncbi:hypothetical protein B1J94_02675 [Leptospira kirschneri serovar Grippotyphosa]|nr:hypothetical protein B1J94_02675 [Leptospira kirschneri serovar Grippotyphosa]
MMVAKQRFYAKTGWMMILFVLELLKNSIVQFNKTISIARFHEIETDGEFIFQQLYFIVGPTIFKV